jgi:IS1 transposase/DDE domain
LKPTSDSYRVDETCVKIEGAWKYLYRALDEPAYPRRVHDLEMDEFWSFVGAKQKQRWTWYGYDRQRCKVVAFVNERRTDAAAMINTADAPSQRSA